MLFARLSAEEERQSAALLEARATIEAAQQRATDSDAARAAAEQAARRQVEQALAAAELARQAQRQAEQRACDTTAEVATLRAEVQRLRAATVTVVPPSGPVTTAQASRLGMILRTPSPVHPCLLRTFFSLDSRAFVAWLARLCGCVASGCVLVVGCVLYEARASYALLLHCYVESAAIV
jgi:hypothetical protein